MAWRGQDQGISVVLNKRLDLGFAFGLENRTSAIQQSATGFDQGPKRFEQLGLNVGQLRHIGLAAQPTHIGVSPTTSALVVLLPETLSFSTLLTPSQRSMRLSEGADTSAPNSRLPRSDATRAMPVFRME